MPRANLKGKTAFITGGGKGIGKAIALYFAERGLQVVITGRDEKALKETCDEIQKKNGKAFYFKADVTDKEQITDAILKTKEKFGSLDVLVNNAGVLELGEIEKMPMETYRRLMETNYFALVQLTLAALPIMRAQNFGRIVNIASVGAKKSFPKYGAYDATKFAVAGFTDALRIELKGSPVCVSMIHPGGVDTNMGAPLKAKGSLARRTLVSADAVAKAAYKAAVTGAAEIYVPFYTKTIAVLNVISPAVADTIARMIVRD